MRKFYLQDTRSYVGNSVLWWREGGGYTTDLNKAQLFTEAEARALNTSRYTDIPWLKDYIDTKSISVVDMQYIKRKEETEFMKGDLK